MCENSFMLYILGIQGRSWSCRAIWELRPSHCGRAGDCGRAMEQSRAGAEPKPSELEPKQNGGRPSRAEPELSLSRESWDASNLGWGRIYAAQGLRVGEMETSQKKTEGEGRKNYNYTSTGLYEPPPEDAIYCKSESEGLQKNNRTTFGL